MPARIETRVTLPEGHIRRLRELANARHLTEDQLVERALDILFGLGEDGEADEERSGWSALSAAAAARVWDNDDDARYDSWQDLYGTSQR